jgi:hypothetical protein
MEKPAKTKRVMVMDDPVTNLKVKCRTHGCCQGHIEITNFTAQNQIKEESKKNRQNRRSTTPLIFLAYCEPPSTPPHSTVLSHHLITTQE